MLKIQLHYQLKQTHIHIDIDDNIPKIYALRGTIRNWKDDRIEYDCRFKTSR